MSFVLLRDIDGRSHTFNLPHEVYCAARGKCSCRMEDHRRMGEDRKAGRRWVVKRKLRICESITLMPRSRTGPLDEAVLVCPEVEAAINARHIMVEPWNEPVVEAAVEAPVEKPKQQTVKKRKRK